jgi:hypothetical protein
MAIIEEFNSSSQVKRNVLLFVCKKYFYMASSENLYVWLD